jgi:hypothetical protein
MPTKTKKGKSKPGKARKTTNKKRRPAKRGVEGRPGATRRMATGRVTATGTSFPKMTESSNRAGKATSPPPILAPEGSPDQKATGKGATRGEDVDRVRIL